MTDLPALFPGGIDPATYEWYWITVITEAGVTSLEVHCFRCCPENDLILIAFGGRTEPDSPQRRGQVGAVAGIAQACGYAIEELRPGDINTETALRLDLAYRCRDPQFNVALLAVTRPF